MTMKNMMQKLLSYVISIALIAGIILIINVIQNAVSNEKFKDFQPYLEQYRQAGDKTLPSTDTPNRPMKIIILSSHASAPYQFDDMYSKLPESIRAEKHEEVNTVVQIDRSEEKTGKYEDGCYGYREIALVYVVDVETNRTVFVNTFRGSMPPDTKTWSGDAYGSLPDDEIIKRLESLNND